MNSIPKPCTDWVRTLVVLGWPAVLLVRAAAGCGGQTEARCDACTCTDASPSTAEVTPVDTLWQASAARYCNSTTWPHEDTGLWADRLISVELIPGTAVVRRAETSSSDIDSPRCGLRAMLVETGEDDADALGIPVTVVITNRGRTELALPVIPDRTIDLLAESEEIKPRPPDSPGWSPPGPDESAAGIVTLPAGGRIEIRYRVEFNCQLAAGTWWLDVRLRTLEGEWPRPCFPRVEVRGVDGRTLLVKACALATTWNGIPMWEYCPPEPVEIDYPGCASSSMLYSTPVPVCVVP